MSEHSPKYTNSLAKESSPYLLQHAHNPVDWMPWGDKAREKALSENKLMLVSVGYSSCHWCHVMERESFENEEVAELMNRHFVCVKVDREERPDVDQVYMDAVQAMTRQGGWPLNCFTTPDGKPVYGGTYFPKESWMGILNQLAELWKRDPQQVKEYGDSMADGMQVSRSIPIVDSQKTWDIKTIHKALDNWTTRMDGEYGGPNKAPKFALPANYIFLLRYGALTKDKAILNHVELTLDKMAQGGIYDQVGGGFTRYSTDKYWKVPHFEKMLYDNAQLLSLYAEAFHYFKKPDYLHISQGIEAWLNREMIDDSGSYYSAIDADSEGVEGKFYVFGMDELETHGLLEDYSRFYQIDYHGLWEGNLIPVRKGSFQELADKMKISVEQCIQEFDNMNAKLMIIRGKRIRPITDDKSLCSWNAMLAGGLIKTYDLENDTGALTDARRILKFIDLELFDSETGHLSHSWKQGKPSQIGFLEDYAFTISAWLDMYAATFDENALNRARELTIIAIDRFYDREKGFFFFTSYNQTDLIHRPVELSDNVIPASNSVMAHNLHILSSTFDISHYRQLADRLMSAVEKSMEEYPEGYGNWADLYLQKVLGSPEVVIIGLKAIEFYKELKAEFLPKIIFAVSEKNSSLPIFAGRYQADKTLIFICRNQSCLQPVTSVAAAKTELKRLTERFETH